MQLEVVFFISILMMGGKNVPKIGIEMVRNLKSGRHIQVQNKLHPKS